MPGLMIAGFAYLCFNAISLLLALFLADLWLPHTIDSTLWPPLSPWLAAVTDIGLIVLFGLQHSVMARHGFKRWFAAAVPSHLQRTVYVLTTCIMLALLIGCWQPLPAVVWRADALPATVLWVLYGAGWLVAVASTHMINHYELLGLAQAFRHWRGTAPPRDDFRTPYLYRYMRHPLYFGLVLAFWATPQMTVGHLLFAIGMSAYILVGIAYEERDLIAQFGDRYREYRRRVPALIPGFKI